MSVFHSQVIRQKKVVSVTFVKKKNAKEYFNMCKEH